MVRRRHGGGGGGGGGGGAQQGPGGPDRIFADASFWDARVLQVAVVLDVFTLLSDGPATAEDVAVRSATDKRATELLLNALVEIGYLTKRADRYANAPHAQAYLVRGAKDYVGWTVLVEAQAWNTWGNLEQSIRTGKPAPGRLYSEDIERSKTLLKSLHARAEKLFTRHVAEKVKLEGANTLLDLGGGMGSYSIAFARRHPKMNVTIFDLPFAIELAKETVGKTDVHKRVKLQEGDYHKDPLGGPYDVVFLSSVLHTEGEEAAKALLKKVFEALEPGGHVVLRDMFMSPDRTGPAGAVFSLNMLLNTEAGRCYSAAEVD
ncbi:MAG TPA: methyltransferase, partial [bacterium]|nr:methyltransferase [bacterium]